jgi:hypothetical protein
MLCLLASLSAWAGDATNQDRQIKSFALSDQFGAEHRFQFPKTNVSLVVVAEEKGSEQINSWVLPASERYGRKLDIGGVADVSSVPSWMRKSITRRFQKTYSNAILLDWTGAVVRDFAYRKRLANVYLLDRQGKVLKAWTGLATKETLQQLFQAIDQTSPGAP